MMPKVPYPSPGQILLHEFLEPMALGTTELAARMEIAEIEVLYIVIGSRPITPKLAQGLSVALGTSKEFWIGLQKSYDDRQ